MAIPIYRGIFDNTKTYPPLSIVQDSNTQNAILYISTKEVPVSTSLFNPTYWVKYNKSCGLTEAEVQEMIESYCGDLDDLETTDKSSLVNAINEVDDEHEALSETVSDIVDGTQNITYDNTTSGLTATTIKGAIDELSITHESASQISYDNTTSGMSADDVQDAIDELEMTKLESVPNASNSVTGGIRVYFDSVNSVLYITNNGTDPTPTQLKSSSKSRKKKDA